MKTPNEDNWGKVKHVLKYLKGTLHLNMRFRVDDLACAKWHVDASHGVHWDCKGQTTRRMTLGKGALIAFSRRHKGNNRSSTDSKIVGVDDAIPTVLWVLYFI